MILPGDMLFAMCLKEEADPLTAFQVWKQHL